MSDDTKPAENGDDPKPAEGDDPKPAEGADAAKPAEEPKAEEPKAEEPKAEEPKAEEPKAEEPKAEEPKAEEPKSAGDVLAAGDPASKLREEPKAEEPKAEEPKAEEPKAEESPQTSTESFPVEPAPAPTPAEPVGPALVNVGTLIEFESEGSLMSACEKVRDAGWIRWDAHTPYPVHGLDAKMGIKPTILPWIVFAGGLTGCLAGFALQFYTNGIELPFSLHDTVADPFLPSGYSFVTSGKPIFSVPANIPVTFELTILFSAFASFFGMWGLNKLPQWWHPVFQSTRFRRASNDRYFISLEAKDPLYHPDRAQEFAETLGGSHVEALIGEEE